MFRIGRIDYINCDPLFEGLPSHDTAIVPAVPRELNSLMRAGSLDASPISSIEFGRAVDRYFLFPGVGVSASGPIKSVLLLSPRPVEELSGQTIYVSAESATTVVLLRILLRHHYRIPARFESWDLKDGLPEGPVMLIGDPALKAEATERHPHVQDLCEAWVRMTGLPMTFALFCARRAVVDEHRSEMLRLAESFRVRAAAWPASLDNVARAAARKVSLPLPLVRAYLLSLEFRLTSRHIEGLKQFFRLANEIDELESPLQKCLDALEEAALSAGT